MTPLTSVLIVDDEPAICTLLSRWTESLGLEPRTACSAEEAMAALSARHSDLAIVDIMMPGKDGLWLASELQRVYPDTAVVLATANPSMAQAAPPPIADLLIKPFKRERFVLAVDRGREWRRQAVQELEWQARLSLEVRAHVVEIHSVVEKGRTAGRSEVEVLWKLAALRIPEVAAHSERIARYTGSIARELNLDAAASDLVELASRFHDIGKMAVPGVILSKPSPLTPGEIAIMRRHVEAGVEILGTTPALRPTMPIVLASHEWFGGTGYPNRLAGSAIPLASRIIAVADAYDAMTQDRAYRNRLDAAAATAELLRSAPSQFDPDIVVAFLNIVNRH